MSKLANIFRSKGLWEIVKYTLGCGSALLLKMAITTVATALHAQLPSAYLIATICAVVYAFFYHRHVTFGASVDDDVKHFARDFASYTLSVSLFSLFDFLIVISVASQFKEFLQRSGALTMAQIQIANNLCILCSSVILFVLRFFVYRFIFKPRHQ